MARSAFGFGANPDEDWRLSAACLGHDPEWWTISPTSNKEQRAANKVAKSICAGCPVKRQCREFAAETGCWGLIFGGEPVHKPANTRAYERTSLLYGTCDRCGREFTGASSWRRFCSPRCRSASHEPRRKRKVAA